MGAKTRTAWRVNAWLTAALSLGVLVVGNHLARGHLDVRLDLSEDQLYTPSPVGIRMVEELEDLLSVEAYFTGRSELGPVQVAKRLLIDQLEDLRDASRGRMRLEFRDPNTSTEARAAAQSLGILSAPFTGVQGASEVTQDTYLGLVLRYRDEEAVVPFVLPQTFEYVFLGALRGLLREREVTVGFLTGSGAGPAAGESDPYGEVKQRLGERFSLRELFDLELGEAVPADVSVVVVANPVALHPRTVFAVDQFLQRGGRALLLLDRVQVDLARGGFERTETGLEDMLAAWGVTVGADLVWDQGRHLALLAGTESSQERVRVPYPLWLDVTADRLATLNPATSRAAGADLFWASPLELEPVEGVRKDPLVTSTGEAWLAPAEASVEVDPNAVRARMASLVARQGQGAARTLAVACAGRLPSPFVGGAPRPHDPIEEALRRDEDGAGGAPVETTDEPVLSAAADTFAVVVGDANWAADGSSLTPRNRMLFENLVDWLALEDDLIHLRSRFPRERAIADFLQEERRALGLTSRVERGEMDPALARLEGEAAGAAAGRRRFAMLQATGGSLLFALLVFLAWRLVFGRAPRVVAATDGASPRSAR